MHWRRPFPRATSDVSRPRIVSQRARILVRGRRTTGRRGHRRSGRLAGQGKVFGCSSVVRLLSVFGCSSVVGDTRFREGRRHGRCPLSSRALNRAMRNDVVAAEVRFRGSQFSNSETAPMEEIDAASGRAAGSEEEGDRSAAIFSCRALPERTVSAGESHERGVAAVAFHRAEARRSRG